MSMPQSSTQTAPHRSQDGLQRLYRHDDDIMKFSASIARLEAILTAHGLPKTGQVMQKQDGTTQELQFFGEQGEVQVLYAREMLSTNGSGSMLAGEQTLSLVGYIPTAVLVKLDDGFTEDIPNGALPEGILTEPHKPVDYLIDNGAENIAFIDGVDY